MRLHCIARSGWDKHIREDETNMMNETQGLYRMGGMSQYLNQSIVATTYHSLQTYEVKIESLLCGKVPRHHSDAVRLFVGLRQCLRVALHADCHSWSVRSRVLSSCPQYAVAPPVMQSCDYPESTCFEYLRLSTAFAKR